MKAVLYALTAWRQLRDGAAKRPFALILVFTKIRFHDPLHTMASLMHSEGIRPKIVQERLGHSTIQVTMDIYNTLCRPCREALPSTSAAFSCTTGEDSGGQRRRHPGPLR